MGDVIVFAKCVRNVQSLLARKGVTSREARIKLHGKDRRKVKRSAPMVSYSRIGHFWRSFFTRRLMAGATSGAHTSNVNTSDLSAPEADLLLKQMGGNGIGNGMCLRPRQTWSGNGMGVAKR